MSAVRHGEGRIDAERGAIITIALIAILFLSVNVLSTKYLRAAKIDFTENGVYTLSQGTKGVLRSLEDPITLNFYYSRDVAGGFAQIRSHGARVRDMLETFRAISNGKIILNVIEPEPFSREEDEADAYGVRGAPTGSGQSLYFGIAGENTVDGREVIEFLAPEREAFLEYDLVQMIDRLNKPVLPKVGLLTTLPLQFGPGGPQAMAQGAGGPAQIYNLLDAAYELVPLSGDLSTADLDGVGALIIAQPPALSDEAAYAVDQFILHGGRALILLDPVSEFGRASQAQQGDPDALSGLLDAWGVEFDPDTIVLDRARGLRFGQNRNGRIVELSHPMLPRFERDDFDRNDPATADLSRALQMGSVGYFTAGEDAAVTFAPLITTSPESMIIDAQRAMFAPGPEELLQEFAASGVSYAVAARVAGLAPSSYPDGAPEGADADAHLSVAATPINVILIADTDLLDDRYYVYDRGLFVELSADNAFFIQNAVDNLLGSDGLLSVRARAPSTRPMTAVDDLKRDAEAEFLAKEQELTAQLETTETRLRELQSQGSGDSPFLTSTPTPEEQAEIDRFQVQLLDIREELREVQRNLNADIEALKGWMIFFNVWAAPLALTFGAGLMAWRKGRMSRARPKATAGS